MKLLNVLLIVALLATVFITMAVSIQAHDGAPPEVKHITSALRMLKQQKKDKVWEVKIFFLLRKAQWATRDCKAAHMWAGFAMKGWRYNGTLTSIRINLLKSREALWTCHIYSTFYEGG